MGMTIPVAEAIVAEHCYKKIRGEVLFIGRQTVMLDEIELNVLLKKYGLSLPVGFAYEFDSETRGAKGQHFITDRCFMKSLGVEKVSFLDVTDYEGADIVHDLGYTVPDTLSDRYDFIYNGGCFDNMFSPGVAIVNLSKMLRSGGRVICLESASSWNSAYLMYSPGWFWDYYVTNGFTDCKIYLGSFYEGYDFGFGPWKLYYVNLRGKRNTWQETNGPSPAPRANNHFMIISIAEKGVGSTSERQPIQLQYRVDEALANDCKEKEDAIRSCPRPVMFAHKGQIFDQYLTLLGKIGDGVHSQTFMNRIKYTVRRYLRALKIVVIICLDRSVS